MIFQYGLETFIFQRILIGLDAILETYLESMVLPILYVLCMYTLVQVNFLQFDQNIRLTKSNNILLNMSQYMRYLLVKSTKLSSQQIKKR